MEVNTCRKVHATQKYSIRISVDFFYFFLHRHNLATPPFTDAHLSNFRCDVHPTAAALSFQHRQEEKKEKKRKEKKSNGRCRTNSKYEESWHAWHVIRRLSVNEWRQTVLINDCCWIRHVCMSLIVSVVIVPFRGKTRETSFCLTGSPTEVTSTSPPHPPSVWPAWKIYRGELTLVNCATCTF